MQSSFSLVDDVDQLRLVIGSVEDAEEASSVCAAASVRDLRRWTALREVDDVELRFGELRRKRNEGLQPNSRCPKIRSNYLPYCH